MNKRPLGENTDSDVFYDALYWSSPLVNPNVGKIEPPTRAKRTGLLAFADGTNWNPGGLGIGFYLWDGSSWVKQLGPSDTIANATNAHTVDNFHASQTPTASYLLAAASDATMPIKPIWDKTVTGSAVTSVTTDGEVTLDGNAHGGYLLEFIITNGGATPANYSLYANNDQTASNYTREELRAAAAAIAAGGATDAFMIGSTIAAGALYSFFGSLSISPGGYLSAEFRVPPIAAQQVSLCGWSKNATVTNLTRIDIVSSVTSGIGINSRFRLWRRI